MLTSNIEDYNGPKNVCIFSCNIKKEFKFDMTLAYIFFQTYVIHILQNCVLDPVK